MSDKDDAHSVVFNLGQPSKTTGIGALSLGGTAVLAAGVILFVLMQAIGQAKLAFFVVLPLTTLILVLMTLTWDGRSLGESIKNLVKSALRNFNYEDVYVSGPSSRIPGGRFRLPGQFARYEVKEGFDSAGQKYAVLFDRPAKHATVVFDIQPSGQTALSPADRFANTCDWGRWLSSLSLGGDIYSAQICISSRPSTGGLVDKEVRTIIDPNAPWVARQIQKEAAQYLGDGVPEITGHIALTFKVRSSGANDWSFMSNLATRIPVFYEQLRWAGMPAEPMAEAEIAARIQAFYSPASEADFEDLAVEGTDHGIAFSDCGPAVARTARKKYFHDGATSVTWEMAQAPRSTFEDSILTPLLMAHERIPRKRVTITYRPYEAGQGASKVEKEYRDALIARGAGKTVKKAAAEIRVENTDAARKAQALGAQLGRYSLTATATTTDPELLPRIEQDMQQAASQCNIRLRTMNHQQDAGFATSMGFGVTPFNKSILGSD